jgi:putative DNA primase/helicase
LPVEKTVEQQVVYPAEDTAADTLDWARRYVSRGWAVIPIPHRSKKPVLDAWQQLRLREDDLPQHFSGAPQNIGMLMGGPSGWVVDVDLDHPRAVELADEFLPPTPAVFGRPGKPRSHRFFRVTRPVATKQHRSKSAGMIVEIRSTGGQTVVPPSTHETGEPIAWGTEGAEPAEVDPDVLVEIVKRLADTVKIELGEKSAPKPKKERPRRQLPSGPGEPQLQVLDKPERCLRAMLLIGLADHKDGSRRLYTAACRCVEHDLSDGEAVTCIRAYETRRPFPRTWTDPEIIQRLRDAEKVCVRGQALETDAEGLVRLGARDPVTCKLVLSPRRTLPTAEAFIREFHAHPEGRTIVSYAGILMEWKANRYVEIEDERLRQRLQPWLHDALRYVYNKATGTMALADFESNPGTVNAALDTLRACVHLPASVTAPAWLDGSASRPPASELLPCRSMVLHLPTLARIEPTPRLFVTNALNFDYDPDAPPPRRWLEFLDQVLPDDLESVRLLQTWFGYVLTGNTSLQKMLMQVGARRSGKGTVARVLTRLVGPGNVCGPTTSSLAGQFGLQPLIGKSLAIVSDARFCGEHMPIVVERLLCISGEDALTVDRKFLGSVTLKLPTRFMFLTNELPKLSEASGALAGRFLVLRFTQSFYGREDPLLTDRLLEELPGILKWAIEGWHRLRADGRFIEPASSRAAVEELEDLLSPVGAFVREHCAVGPQYRCGLSDLYAAWSRWCVSNGREHPGTVQSFGRDLAAAVPAARTRRNNLTGRFIEGVALAPI